MNNAIAIVAVAVVALVLLRKRPVATVSTPTATSTGLPGGAAPDNGSAPSSGYDAADPYATGAPSTPLPSTSTPKTGYVPPVRIGIAPSTGPTVTARRGRGSF